MVGVGVSASILDFAARRMGKPESARTGMGGQVAGDPYELIHSLVLGHGRRVASMAFELAGASGLDRRRCALLAEAAYLHDLGKLDLPASILFKVGALTSAERLALQIHPASGYRFVNRFAARMRIDCSVIASVCLHHHEQWDGSGYPLGLAGSSIPREAQIVALADVFDALVSGRSYKPAWPRPEALLAIGDDAGKRFNPELVAPFLELAADPLFGCALEPIGGCTLDFALDAVASRAFVSSLLLSRH